MRAFTLFFSFLMLPLVLFAHHDRLQDHHDLDQEHKHHESLE